MNLVRTGSISVTYLSIGKPQDSTGTAPSDLKTWSLPDPGQSFARATPVLERISAAGWVPQLSTAVNWSETAPPKCLQVSLHGLQTSAVTLNSSPKPAKKQEPEYSIPGLLACIPTCVVVKLIYA